MHIRDRLLDIHALLAAPNPEAGIHDLACQLMFADPDAYFTYALTRCQEDADSDDDPPVAGSAAAP